MITCRRCNLTKGSEHFYFIPVGSLGVCKECAKARVKKRYKEKIKDPSFIESEQERGREKYHRLGYRYKGYKTSLTSRKKYRDSNPEKINAISKSSHIFKKGFQKHHWSYKEEFAKDVIFLTIEDHNLLHRLTKYNKETFSYVSKIDNSELNTKRKVINFMKKLEITNYSLNIPF